MNQQEMERRAQVIDAALTAHSEEDVEAAIQDLDRWLQDHPEDDSIRDGYEPLILRQMFFEAQRQNAVVLPALTSSATG